jgi:enterochelin esterase-like enzyme
VLTPHARSIVAAAALAVAATAVLAAQGRRGGAPPAPVGPGTVERVNVGDREVVVYLPPSYASDAMRRFPVVYVLAERPIENLGLPEAADRLARAPGFSEPIVVLPDVSGAAGDRERAVAEELVSYVDGRYRTIAARISRGLAGDGTAGDAALQIAMKRADVFSSLYLESATLTDATLKALDGAAANLQHLYAIAVEAGTRDALVASNRQLHDAMARLKIPHYYEEYDGGHADKVRERIATRVLPFFSKNLTAPANPTSPAVQ